MSNMLEQAIIDADALKEAAIKNAEATIVEKYSADIKKAVEQLLEQPAPEEMMMPPSMEPQMSAPETSVDAPPSYTEGGEGHIQVDLQELLDGMKMGDVDPNEYEQSELVAEEIAGTGEDVPIEGSEEVVTISESVIADILGEELYDEDDDLYEEEDLYEVYDDDDDDDLYEEEDLYEVHDEDDDLYEEAAFDPAEPDVSGRVGAVYEQLQIYQHHYTKLYESHQEYEQNYAQLYQQAGQLNEQNNKFRSLLFKVQKRLNEVNTQNSKLLYTNRILNSNSLNERQKDKIVEAVSKANSVEEAKTIFEALQSAVAGTREKKKGPKSLSEAVNRSSSAFLPRNRKEEDSNPQLVDRMQLLAGIK